MISHQWPKSTRIDIDDKEGIRVSRRNNEQREAGNYILRTMWLNIKFGKAVLSVTLVSLIPRYIKGFMSLLCSNCPGIRGLCVVPEGRTVLAVERGFS